MLGSAPGTGQLAGWMESLREGMTLEDLANHIASSDTFKAQYGTSTNPEFAAAFLTSVSGGEISASIQTMAEEIVVGLLEGGASRGEVALLVVTALHDIHNDMDHPARDDLGMAAANLVNRTEVAEYYVLDEKGADASSSVLEGVTSDPASIGRAIHHIDSPAADAMFNEVGELSINENMTSGMVGSVTATDPNSTADYPEPVTYSLKDAPEGFSIDMDTGAISYAGDGLDHETADTIALTVVATSIDADGTPTGVERMVHVQVGDVAESAAVFETPGEFMLAEHQSGSGAGNAVGVGNITAMDAEGDEVTYSIKGDPADWAILADGKLCYTGDGIDYETTPSVDLTIVATSLGDGGMEQSVEQDITVQIVNQHDAVFGDDMLMALNEGDKEAALGSVSATDADEGDTVTYSLKGSAVDADNDGLMHSGFAVDSATGAISYMGNGISASVSEKIALTVVATSRGDNGMDTAVEHMITIDIVAQAGPVFGDDTGGFTLAENADGSTTGGIPVGMVSASDVNGDMVSFSIEDEDWEVDADGNISYVGEGLDHEAGATVDVTVVATSGPEGSEATEEKMVQVAVGNLNDNAPMIGEPAGEAMLNAGTPEADTATGLTVAVTDADGDMGSYSVAVYEGEGEDMAVSERFKAVASDDDAMSFSIVAIAGQEIAEGDIMLTVKASDGEHESEAAMVNFTVGAAAASEPVMGEVYNLTRSRDNIRGTADNDTIISDPDSNGLPTLNSFDSIDGGDGWDVLQIFDIEPSVSVGEGSEKEGGLEIDSSVDALVENVEEVYIHARGQVDVDLTEWEGLEKLELGRFGVADNVNVEVDGASVETTRTFRGDVTIKGAGGDLSLMAASDSTVIVGSGEHTTSVMVKGGATVDVSGNGQVGNSASQSMSVTNVVIDGVKLEGLGTDKARGTKKMPVKATIDADNENLDPSATTQHVTWDGTDATVVTNAQVASDTVYYIAEDQPDDATTNLAQGQVVVTTVAAMAEMVDDTATEDSGDVPVHVYSDAIESIALHNTQATVFVGNKSEDAEELTVTVNKYGTAAINGKLCLTDRSDGHKGSPANISIMVAGDSDFILAGNATKVIDVTLDADLELGVTTFANPNPSTPSGTFESVTLTGDGGFKMNAMGHDKLTTIDASGAGGSVAITNVGASVTSYMGGTGADSLHLAGYNAKGVMVDLGAGDDRFTSGAGNDKSRVDGGDGEDTLHLKNGATTYTPEGGKPTSIYSNFEKLNVGGGQGTYDVSLLGVDSVMVSESTMGTGVTLTKMADGMGISVTGKGGKMDTDATIVHSMMDSTAGNRHSGALDVSLTATGHKDDTKASGSGAAMLTLTADEEIELLNVASNATVAGKATAGVYRNTFTLMGMESNSVAAASEVEVINVTGGAAVTVSVVRSDSGDAAQFGELEEIDASGNSGGVMFSADLSGDGSVVLSQALELIGGIGNDDFTGGSANDTLIGGGGDDMLSAGGGQDGGDNVLRGGAGMDELTGGGGTDQFQFTANTDSQLTFAGEGMARMAKGFDTIEDFATGDKIMLSKELFKAATGTIKSAWNSDNATVKDKFISITAGDTNNDDNIANGLEEFVTGNKDGFFETQGAEIPGVGASHETDSHSIAVIVEGSDLWVFIDVDGDGDLSDADMAIKLMGIATIASTDFDEITS